MTKDEKIDRLIEIAFDLLHHDADYSDPDGLDGCNYETAQLMKKKFRKVIGSK